MYNKPLPYGILRPRSTNSITELVTLSEAKDHLRVTNSDDDTYITTLISVARSICEQYVGFFLSRNSSMVYYLDRFPDSKYIILNGVWMPGTVIIQYYDTNDSQQTISSSDYNIDENSRPARIKFNENTDYPEASENIPNPISIRMTNCGPSDVDELPKAIHQAILMTIGHYYENRQDVIVGSGKPYDMPKASEHLLNPFRIVGV